jgi:hypothetical protein
VVVSVEDGWCRPSREAGTLASIETRKTKKDLTRFRVRWQEGGGRDGDWDGVTFEGHAEAKRFKGLVDANLNRRPSNEQLLEHGFDYLLPESWLRRSEPDAVVPHDGPDLGADAVPTFLEYALRYIDHLDHIGGYQRKRYGKPDEPRSAPALVACRSIRWSGRSGGA